MGLKKGGGDRFKRRFSPMLWLASLSAIAVLALGVTGTLSQIVASITNSNNSVQTAGPSSFGLSEALGPNGTGGVCATASGGSTATCSTINKFGVNGAAGVPLVSGGGSNTTTVTLANTASTTPPGVTGTLTVTGGTCSSAPVPGSADGTADLCGIMNVVINCTGASTNPVFSGNLNAFTAASPITITTLAPAASTDCTFTTSLPAGNETPAQQDVVVSQPITFALSGA